VLIFGIPLIFFFPLVVHVWAGLATGITGVGAFRAPKLQRQHHRWGKACLWAYTVVFLTATMLTFQRWKADGYLFFLALAGYGLTLTGYGVRRFHQHPWVKRLLGKQWVVAHSIGMISSYIVLWTAFYVDNAHLFPGMNRLPQPTFWVLPTLIGLPFLILSIIRFAPQAMASSPESQER
jgi:hypothetical protein